MWVGKYLVSHWVLVIFLFCRPCEHILMVCQVHGYNVWHTDVHEYLYDTVSELNGLACSLRIIILTEVHSTFDDH